MEGQLSVLSLFDSRFSTGGLEKREKNHLTNNSRFMIQMITKTRRRKTPFPDLHIIHTSPHKFSCACRVSSRHFIEKRNLSFAGIASIEQQDLALSWGSLILFRMLAPRIFFMFVPRIGKTLDSECRMEGNTQRSLHIKRQGLGVWGHEGGEFGTGVPAQKPSPYQQVRMACFLLALQTIATLMLHPVNVLKSNQIQTSSPT